MRMRQVFHRQISMINERRGVRRSAVCPNSSSLIMEIWRSGGSVGTAGVGVEGGWEADEAAQRRVVPRQAQRHPRGFLGPLVRQAERVGSLEPEARVVGRMPEQDDQAEFGGRGRL